MARPLRIQFENTYYHVTCRGNARQEIFSNDADRFAFLDLLGGSSEIYQTEILVYVLMPNHFHLLLKTPLGNLQEFMRHFNISYTSYYNHKHNRGGHLYQGRYKSFLVDADHYLQEVSRYIHLNPVRTKLKSGMTLEEKKEHLENYRWSSYSGYISTRARRRFVRVKEVLAYFGEDTSQGRRKYEKFVIDGLSGKIENPFERGKGHGIVGETEFVDAIRRQYLSDSIKARELPAVKKILAQVEPEKILRVVCREFGVNREELLKRGYRGVGRGLLMEFLYRHGGMNQQKIGELVGIDYSSVSVSRKRFQAALVSEDGNLLDQMEKIRAKINQG